MTMEAVSIRRLNERIVAGEIRIPKFQRGFVWDSKSVAALMDSIYRRFPIGAILLWRTREQLAGERNLGPFEIPEPKNDWPIDYVLDGQQRITSIFGVFQTDLAPTETGDWFDVYFDLRAAEGALESQFVALPQSQVVGDRHFPLRTLFDSVEYRKATATLSEADVKRIDDLQSVFKEALIPTETIETVERQDVAIIFERVNRSGVPLDAFQLLSAWTWNNDFDLSEAFEDLAADVEPFGFGKLDGEPNLLMKCIAAVVANNANPDTIMSLHGPTVRDRFDEIRSGVLGAIEFLRRELRVHSLEIMPFPAMIVPLTRFFATTQAAGIHPDTRQRAELIRWFWRSCYSRRYSSGVGRAHETDIRAMADLKANPATVISGFQADVDERFFLDNQFNLSSVNTRTFVLALAQLSPRSLLSGSPVDLERVLQTCNRAEFHHVFPKHYLDDLNVTPKKQNVLANLCFLSSADNQRIKAKAPSEYKQLISQSDMTAILGSHLVPSGGLDADYDGFLAGRAELLTRHALQLMA